MYGHGGHLRNEWADPAAALGTFELTSSHNGATRWILDIFDASVCFYGSNHITEAFERLQHVGTDAASLSQNGSEC